MKELLDAWHKFCKQEYDYEPPIALYAIDSGGYDATFDVALTLNEESGLFILDILGEKFKLALVG